MPVPSAKTGRLEVSGQDGFVTRSDAGGLHPRVDEPVRRRQHRRSGDSRLRRGAHHLLLWLRFLAAAVIIVIGFGLWRLMQGPVDLDRLIPYVQQALNRSTDGLRFSLSGVQ